MVTGLIVVGFSLLLKLFWFFIYDLVQFFISDSVLFNRVVCFTGFGML